MRGLVCSGGGVLGSYQVGQIKHLMGDLGHKYDIYAGVSVGAINSLGLAQFKSGHEQMAAEYLEDMWYKLDNSKVKRFYFPPYISALWKDSFYSSEPLKKFIRDNLSVTSLKSSGKQLRVLAASLNTGALEVWTEEDEDIVEGVMASSAFPGFLTPEKIKGQQFIDGGIRNVTPLETAIKAGATEIDVLVTAAKQIDPVGHHMKTVGVLKRTLGIMINEIMENDIKIVQLKNKVEGYRNIKLNIYRPQKPMLYNHLDFDPKVIRELVGAGYNEIREQLK